jgi:hypothetical protein
MDRRLLDRQSLTLPIVAAALTAVTLAVGYHYADQTQHRPPPPPAPLDRSWPNTALLTGTLVADSQRVLSLHTDAGTFAVILGQQAVPLPTCGRYPTFALGERLAVRVPARGDTTLLVAMIQDAGPCPR